MTLPNCYRCDKQPCECNCSVYHDSCLDILPLLPEKSMQTCVTSPPYWGLRDYGVDGQLGLEPTIEEYVANMVEVFRGVRRVLRDDGTVWLNLGDTYNSGNSGARDPERWPKQSRNNKQTPRAHCNTLKHKDLCGIPWYVAFALQADGWYLRQDIIWAKPNPMPESVTDRCTKSHEYIFLLSKGPRYFYDAEAIKEPATYAGQNRGGSTRRYEQNAAGMDNKQYATRNRRSVWTVNPVAFKDAHFATFPPKLIEPCILAGTSNEGCCPECGAPWKRVTERVDTGKTQKMPDGMATYAGDHGTIHRDGREKGKSGNPITATTTTGWEPTCDHYPFCDPETNTGYDPSEPCTVLDPFHGAGTTGMVAQANGRKYVGIELSEEYIEMSLKRLRQEVLF